MDTKKKTILYVSLWPWRDLWQRPQHLATNLSQYYNIIFIDSLPFSMHKSLVKSLTCLNKINKTHTHKDCIVFSYYFFPCGKLFFLRKLNNWFWAKAVNRYIKKNKLNVDILWISSPDQLAFIENIDAKEKYYDCMDDYQSFEEKLKK